MIFIGGGTLLSRAVAHVAGIGATVDAVCCPPGDPCLPKLYKMNVKVIESNNPNIDLLPIGQSARSTIAFSINNRMILGDALLDSGPVFFNIHNGLVQHYRGVAEVCIFAAICRAEPRYGVTLHQLLPGQKVDTGPVVTQREFMLKEGDVFAKVMTQSLAACQTIFEDNLQSILAGHWVAEGVEFFGAAYAYKDLPRIFLEADAAALQRARTLGPYAGFFPRLHAAVGAA